MASGLIVGGFDFDTCDVELAAVQPQRFCVIDAQQSVGEIAALICDDVANLLE